MLYEEKIIETIPVGPLGLIPLKSCAELGKKVDEYLVAWRKERESEHKSTIAFAGYQRDSYIVKASTPRFGSGEGKGMLEESVRGDDLYIMVDVCNYNLTYSLCGMTNHMSPDDHFQDLKRVIAAAAGKARRINVIMPFLYESRQHKRSSRESLDCALALEELVRMGVENIITFDAHDPRVQNAAPLMGFDNVMPTYQVLKALINQVPNLKLDWDNFMIVSPDEGAMQRNMYYSSVLGVNLGMFYKRRDFTRVVNGRNPIVAHEFLGDDVEGKDVIIVDDMISSGDSMIEVAKKLKDLKANRIFICTCFGLFCEGLNTFDEAYEKGLFDRVFTTNLVYRSPELLERKWYCEVDMSKYISYIIDTLNHDMSVSKLLNPSDRIYAFLERKGYHIQHNA